MFKRVCYFVTTLCSCFSAFSQDLMVIEGTISDKRSDPVSYASVYLLNTNFFVLSNSAGNFEIKNVPAGDYMIAISAIGYATISKICSISDMSHACGVLPSAMR